MCDDSAKKYDVIKSSTLGCDAETDQTKLMQLSFKSAPSAEKQCIEKQYNGMQCWDCSKIMQLCKRA